MFCLHAPQIFFVVGCFFFYGRPKIVCLVRIILVYLCGSIWLWLTSVCCLLYDTDVIRAFPSHTAVVLEFIGLRISELVTNPVFFVHNRYTRPPAQLCDFNYVVEGFL
jgi:hypothetical protein